MLSVTRDGAEQNGQGQGTGHPLETVSTVPATQTQGQGTQQGLANY